MTDAQRRFADQAAKFALIHNSRTINCTPRAEELIAMLQAAYDAGVAAENEACAQLMEHFATRLLGGLPDLGGAHNCREFARAIRARQKEGST